MGSGGLRRDGSGKGEHWTAFGEQGVVWRREGSRADLRKWGAVSGKGTDQKAVGARRVVGDERLTG